MFPGCTSAWITELTDGFQRTPRALTRTVFSAVLFELAVSETLALNLVLIVTNWDLSLFGQIAQTKNITTIYQWIRVISENRRTSLHFWNRRNQLEFSLPATPTHKHAQAYTHRVGAVGYIYIYSTFARFPTSLCWTQSTECSQLTSSLHSPREAGEHGKEQLLWWHTILVCLQKCRVHLGTEFLHSLILN